ncbi:olfactory receptor 5V1-like [Spea bombifrons]|uniref:olfactory receptor 5V1-like n=1 Tax=Spea bombifrons TaxID=233779 RepID=UPI0023493877|nr:olfactory receptor 5V1-like [Spea bombifrons]
MNNESMVAEFILLGLSSVPEMDAALFSVFLIMYLICMTGNLAIIIIACVDPALNTPMYFLLANLSFLDVVCTTSTIPNMLVNFFSESKVISFQGCVVQMFVFTAAMDTEFLLLTLMSLDRYLAICNPLRYKSIMSKQACICMSAVVWSFGLCSSTYHTSSTFRLSFCASNKINHFFCEIPQILALSCSDTHINELVLIVTDVILGVVCFVLIFMSYVFIIIAVLKIRSVEGKKKAFSTCASHLTVVVLFYGTLIFAYFRPSSGNSSNTDKIIAVLYTIVIPMLNPLLYSLRNKEVKESIKKVIFRQNHINH